jgi:hypothetical protein
MRLVNPEAIDSAVQPKFEDVLELSANLWVLPV